MRDQQVMTGFAALEPPKSKQTGVPRASRRASKEQWEQTELFRYLSKFYARYPHLEWVHAIPNGLFTGYDESAKSRAADAVRAGLRKGVWDIFVPFPRKVNGILSAHGMYVEMKADANTLTIDQERFGGVMQRSGYVCIVCRSWHEAATAILEYLGDCPAALNAVADAAPGFSLPPPAVKPAPKEAI